MNDREGLPPAGTPWQPAPYGAWPGPPPAAPPRPPDGLATALLVLSLLWIGPAITAAYGASMVGRAGDATTGPLMFLAGSFFAGVGMLVIGILTIRWQERTRKVAQQLGGSVPGWTSAAWFLPLANLVVPPWTVYAVLRAGARPDTAAGDGQLVSAWWIAWLAAWLTTWVAFSHGGGAEAPGSPFGAASWGAAACWAVCAALFAAVAVRVRARQQPAVRPAS